MNLFFLYIYGLLCEKCIMDPLALSYPLTNINIHVQYWSNLIMCTTYDYSLWRNPGELFVVFRGTKVSAKTSAQETHAQLRTSLSSVKRELSSMGGGGLLWSEWANLAFRLYFKTSSQNRHMCNKGKITTYFWKMCICTVVRLAI